MKVVILRGASNSFAFKYEPVNGLGINIANGDDIIEVFQWINREFRNIKDISIFNGGACHE